MHTISKYNSTINNTAAAEYSFFLKFMFPLAGGLATYIHADYVKSVLDPSVKYHAIADAGYFIDGQNINGQHFIQGVYEYGTLLSVLCYITVCGLLPHAAIILLLWIRYLCSV